MADDLTKKGKQDRSRSSSQEHEVSYRARKPGKPSAGKREAKPGSKGSQRSKK